jgi:hypothetical protein
MRRLWSAALAAAVMVLGGQAVDAQEGGASVSTTAELAAMCGMADRSFCFGYLNGAGQFYEALIAHEEVDVDPFVCPGREVTEEEAVAVFLDWYENNPDAAGEPAIDGLFRAWVAAFPCE